MEEYDVGPTADETYEDITKFDNIMFLVNPIRAMKFAELLSNISEFSGLRIKLIRASKNSSFSKIADYFQFSHSEDYKKIGENKLPESINDFLDELNKNKEINFTTNDIKEIQEALNFIFGMTNKDTSDTIGGIKGRLLQLVK